jgi:class 3 adenylate cyclase
MGAGPDLVLVSPWLSHLEARWDVPEFEYLYRRLASFSRFISFDKYGMGLSDPAPPGSLPTLEEWADDVGTVMDAAGSPTATIFGIADGGMMAAMFAATYPERTRSLALLNSTARISWAPDYPIGWPPERQDIVIDAIEEAWGATQFVSMTNPTVDPGMQRSWAREGRLAASPATARAVFQMLFQLDIRSVLPSISAPTLVLRAESPQVSTEQVRYLAEHIPAARLAELPGSAAHPTIADMEALAAVLEEFVTGTRASLHVDRVLTTVLFTDIVGSTRRAAELGDSRWKEVLNTYERLTENQIRRHQGRLVDRTGDGLLATFDGPARAIRCAQAMQSDARTLGVEIRAGLHTGEVERRGESLAGLAVHIAARIQAIAGPGEILVSRTVCDLVVGSGIAFIGRGAHQLKGIPDEWHLFAVAS